MTEHSRLHMEEHEAERFSMVRSFTHELEGKNDLEVGTKAAQEMLDVVEEEKRRSKVAKILVTDENAISNLTADAERMRDDLKNACDAFFASENKEEEPKWYKPSKKSSKQQLEQRMQQTGLQDIEDVKDLVEKLQDSWKSSHGKVFKNFQKMCSALDAHKDIFTLIPTENIYVKTLSGAFTMIVQASVRHHEIAEKLSGAVAHLCERSNICIKLARVIDTAVMKDRLSKLYKSLFRYLCEAARWFTKNRWSRLWDSFGSDTKSHFESAEESINATIGLMVEDSHAESLAKIEETRVGVLGLEHSVDHGFREMVKEQRHANKAVEAGFLVMQQLFLANITSSSEGNNAAQLQLPDSTSDARGEAYGETHKPSASMSREDASHFFENLKMSMSGSDGLQLAQVGEKFLADDVVVQRLTKWMDSSAGKPNALLIGFPWEQTEDTSARTAAIGVITTLGQAAAPFISHLCGKPRKTDGMSKDQVGLLSLVYSLSAQLLEFRPQPDSIELDCEQLELLDWKNESWGIALKILSDLIDHTPLLRYCIIDGIHKLDSKDTQIQLQQLFDVLLSRARKPGSGLHILFTVSGQSRVLKKLILETERISTQEPLRRVQRRGQILRGEG